MFGYCDGNRLVVLLGQLIDELELPCVRKVCLVSVYIEMSKTKMCMCLITYISGVFSVTVLFSYHIGIIDC